jgi:hypothetical protein
MYSLKLFLFLCLAVVFTACGGNTYYLYTEDAYGIDAGDDVYRQGIDVGEVEEVGFDGNQVKIEISINEPLYEGQGFRIREGMEGAQLELDRPASNANALADGATLRSDFFGEGFLEGIEHMGSAIGNALENAFGPNGEKLERSLEQLGENLERKAEAWSERMENGGESQEQEFEDLERKLRIWADGHEAEFEELGREIDTWAADFDGDLEDLARVMDRVSDEHPVGSRAWKKALKNELEALK